jgi:hypothetical protein
LKTKLLNVNYFGKRNGSAENSKKMFDLNEKIAIFLNIHHNLFTIFFEFGRNNF